MSNIAYTKSFKKSSLSIAATQNQTVQKKYMDISFPSLTYNINRFFPFRRQGAVKQNVFDKIGVSYLAQFNNTLSGKDSLIFKSNPLDSMKFGLKQSIPVSTNFNLFKYITVTPGANVNVYSYARTTSQIFALPKYFHIHLYDYRAVLLH